MAPAFRRGLISAHNALQFFREQGPGAGSPSSRPNDGGAISPRAAPPTRSSCGSAKRPSDAFEAMEDRLGQAVSAFSRCAPRCGQPADETAMPACPGVFPIKRHVPSYGPRPARRSFSPNKRPRPPSIKSNQTSRSRRVPCGAGPIFLTRFFALFRPAGPCADPSRPSAEHPPEGTKVDGCKVAHYCCAEARATVFATYLRLSQGRTRGNPPIRNQGDFNPALGGFQKSREQYAPFLPRSTVG